MDRVVVGHLTFISAQSNGLANLGRRQRVLLAQFRFGLGTEPDLAYPLGHWPERKPVARVRRSGLDRALTEWKQGCSMGSKLETVRTYWEASARSDYETAGACVAIPGYVWIDHTKGVVAETMEQLLESQSEDAAWSQRTFDITNSLDTTDGALVVQATISGVLNGEWCSLRGTGQRVSFDACVIFRFDDEGRIKSEEHYSDAMTVMQQVNSPSDPSATDSN